MHPFASPLPLPTSCLCNETLSSTALKSSPRQAPPTGGPPSPITNSMTHLSVSTFDVFTCFNPHHSKLCPVVQDLTQLHSGVYQSCYIKAPLLPHSTLHAWLCVEDRFYSTPFRSTISLLIKHHHESVFINWKHTDIIEIILYCKDFCTVYISLFSCLFTTLCLYFCSLFCLVLF